MKREMIALAGLCLLAVTACSKPAEAPQAAAREVERQPGVRMDVQTQARMGVRVAPIASADAPQVAQGYARVMDVGPLAAIASEISAAQAAASASEGEYRRLSALAAQDQAASARAVDAARAQAAGDAARATLAVRRIGLEWGPGLERLSSSERARLLNGIAAGRTALLRIDAPDANGAISRVAVYPEEGAAAIPVSILGPAAATDPRLQTGGVLGIVHGASARALPAGRLLRAELELGAPQSGFLLPSSALIRAENSVWVYVKTGPDTFERRDVSSGRAVADGWYAAHGFSELDQVAVDGATSLLAAEHGPADGE